MGVSQKGYQASARLPGLDVDLTRILDAVPNGVCVLDHDLRYLFCNEALAAINGLPASHHIGRSVAEVLPDLMPTIERAFRDVLAGRASSGERKVSGMTPRHPGLVRTWLEKVRPLTGADGNILAIVVTVEEITALEAAEAQLRESEQAFRASQQLRTDGFIILRGLRDEDGAVADFMIEFANPAIERLLGAERLVDRRLIEAYPASADHPELFPRFRRLLGTTEPDEAEMQYDDDGALSGWFRVSAVALDSERLAVSLRDISARKRSEEQLRIVTLEFRHRIKNLLAVVGALVGQEAKHAEDVGSFVAAIQQRLGSLSAAQDLLLGEFEGGASLSAIVAAALDPFDAGVAISGGPPVQIASACVVQLTLALNELATNALKHGATGNRAPRIGWSETDGRVTLCWSESGAAAAPRRQGFGSRLLELVARGLPHGVLRIDRTDGLRIELAFDSSAG